MDYLEFQTPGVLSNRAKNAEWAKEIEATLKEQRRRQYVARKAQKDLGPELDRLVPQVFSAGITGSTLQTPVSGRTWWLYTWQEVERTAVGDTFPTVSYGRTDQIYGEAVNAYEVSAADNGDNIVPGTSSVSRLAIPVGRVVDMVVDPAGRAWFTEQNPVEISCTGGSVTFVLDGGEFNGGV
jgi:hypothetical protein